MQLRYDFMKSPVGRLLIVSNEEALVEIRFEKNKLGIEPEDGWCRGGKVIDRARKQLEEYFAGRRTEFDLPLAPEGTPFQQRVWQELQAIPFGVTISYGELARRVGNPAACRAVGAANGKNPVSIVIPCHRVIGSSGSLTGFGGGLDAKKTLLGVEGMQPASGNLFPVP